MKSVLCDDGEWRDAGKTEIKILIHLLFICSGLGAYISTAYISQHNNNAMRYIVGCSSVCLLVGGKTANR